MKYFFIFFILYIFLYINSSCQKSKNTENQFTSLADTLLIKTKKVKGRGVFELGYGQIDFKDTSEIFWNSIKYPKNIDSIKRFQLKVDFREEKHHNIEILIGSKDGNQVFTVDENNNKDLTDDSVRPLESIIWTSPPELVKCEYLISNGKEMVKDFSWLCIGKAYGKILLGRREHMVGKFKIDTNHYTIGVIEPRNIMSFSYNLGSKTALLSNSVKENDTISYSDLLSFKEFLNLNNQYYRFEKISNNGDLITLVKDKNFKTKIGTQKGMIAPNFEAITISRDTINSSILGDRLTAIVNSCGCGGDKKSTQIFYEMVALFGDSVNLLHVDSNIGKSDIGIHIDSEEAFNSDFYDIYRKEYCSRICYLIDENKRIIDKFDILTNDWELIIEKALKN